MRIIDIGITDFLKAWEYQKAIVRDVDNGLCEDTLILTEHYPVITIGRQGKSSNILKSSEFLKKNGIDIIEVDRGGDVTYHGPGQLIGYPIFRLKDRGRDVHKFLEFLEDIGRHFLTQYGLTSKKIPGLRGIWVNGKKIGSIGIGIRRWVTYHGMAININVELTPFSFIKPCGIEDLEMTSLKELLGCDIDIDEAKLQLIRSFDEKISSMAETVYSA